ncbi:MAG: carboxylating nicotinate-nucleotide diphosphorylase [Deltaproteobacteria bacterium]|nr:carboxylating nicotinate-nucleotide diphosphorylase [Deltaproteobacteria bacterium]
MPSSDPLIPSPAIRQLIDLALEEDLGLGDVTTRLMGPPRPAVGQVVARQSLVVCGLPLAAWVTERAEPQLGCEALVEEGALVSPGTVLVRLRGPSDALLRVERTVLNFLQRLCGVATLTHRYVEAARGTGARIVDTRKTLPGWRALDKYAVRRGGGHNHRADLSSGILIKDNHITAAGSVAEAVRRARAGAPHTLRVEVEVESLAAAEEALGAGAEVLLLDNFTPESVREVVARVKGRALVELSGGVNLGTVRAFAESGAELISVGALTHSAPAADLAMDLLAAAEAPREGRA